MDVLAWLLDSDPAIRWQVLRDLTDAPAEQIAAERARVGIKGWGARLLALQGPDGQWRSGAPDFPSAAAERWWQSLPPERQGTLFPEWTSTTWSLTLLRRFGIDPDDARTREAVHLVCERCRWEHDGEPYFAGETEPCINGRTVANGAYFGEDVGGIVDRLLGEQMRDGGWNCEQENGSTRGSFHTTIEVLEGLLLFERSTGRSDVRVSRLRGHEYLLERRLFRRMTTGEPIRDRKTGNVETFERFAFPPYWHYDVLRGLEYFREAEAVADERLRDAVELVRSKRDADGCWLIERAYPGRTYFPIDEGEGRPSRWNTLRALRVLRWFGIESNTSRV
jgi:hypothetical protein